MTARPLRRLCGPAPALGFTMRPDERVLREFVAFLERQYRTDAVPAHAAVTWATTTTRPVGPGRHAHRLSIARQFLTYGHALDPGVEIPAHGVLRGPIRPRPHLFTSQEVCALERPCRDQPRDDRAVVARLRHDG